LDKLAGLNGHQLKGSEPDIEGVAKIVLSDGVRGHIPYFVEPPARLTESSVQKSQMMLKVRGAVEKHQQ
jgi:nuclear GTP-binding protein